MLIITKIKIIIFNKNIKNNLNNKKIKSYSHKKKGYFHNEKNIKLKQINI